MFMFQQTSASGARRVLQAGGEVHVAEARQRARGQVRRRQIGVVEVAVGRVEVQIEVQEPGARFAQIAGHRRQQGAGADHIAPRPLALQRLPEPQQRRPPAVEMGGLLDEPGGHAGRRLAPGRGAVREQGFKLLPADGVRGDEVMVDEAVAPEDVEEGKGQGGIAAGKGLEVEIGRLRRGRADGIDHHHLAGRLAQPVLVGVRRRGRGIRAPHHDACRVTGRARVEAVQARPVDIIQRHLAGHVADRVGDDLGGAEAVEEAHREEEGEERDGAGVMGVDDGVRPGGRWICLKRSAMAARAASHETGSKRPSPFGPTRRSGRVRRACGSRHSRL